MFFLERLGVRVCCERVLFCAIDRVVVRTDVRGRVVERTGVWLRILTLLFVLFTERLVVDLVTEFSLRFPLVYPSEWLLLVLLRGLP